MVKPQNAANSLKDKLISLFVDYSAGLTNTQKPFFVDPAEDYDVISISFVHSVNYVGSQAVSVSVGEGAGPSGSATTTKFANAVSMGASAIAAGVETSIALAATRKLRKGHPLTVACAAVGAQSGEGLLCIRLRPKERARGAASKRPGASAQAVS